MEEPKGIPPSSADQSSFHLSKTNNTLLCNSRLQTQAFPPLPSTPTLQVSHKGCPATPAVWMDLDVTSLFFISLHFPNFRVRELRPRRLSRLHQGSGTLLKPLAVFSMHLPVSGIFQIENPPVNSSEKPVLVRLVRDPLVEIIQGNSGISECRQDRTRFHYNLIFLTAKNVYWVVHFRFA